VSGARDHALVNGRAAVCDDLGPYRYPAADCTPAPSLDTVILTAAAADIAPIQRGAEPLWDRYDRRPQAVSVSIRRPADAVTIGSCANRGSPAADTAGRSRCGCPGWGQVLDTADGRPRPSVGPAGAVARGTGRRVNGRCWDAASAGRCVRVGRSGGAELAPVIGHRRPGERAGLLEAEVVDLQPAHLAVLPAADDRLGDLLGVDADLGPGCRGARRAARRSSRP
jgi:hypothetical protein